MLAMLVAMSSQFTGCRTSSRLSQHTRVRDLTQGCSVLAIPTIVLPTLGEGPKEMRCVFQRALATQLQKSKHRTIVESPPFTADTIPICSPCPSNWDEQLESLGEIGAMQAVVSKVTDLQTTAPVKLGIVVELKDVSTRETLRQVEGLWDAPNYHPPKPRKRTGCRVAEPPWSSDLSKISPRYLLEQAAVEISSELQEIAVI